MKKYAFLICTLLCCATAVLQAQTYDLYSQSNSKILDTVTNTGVRVLYTTITGSPKSVAIDYTCTKISGTVAGTVKPVVSNDALKWYPAAVLADSNHVTATDVASQGGALYPYTGFKYYGVQWTGSGTMAASIHAKATIKQ